jgi:hypothetical protein
MATSNGAVNRVHASNPKRAIRIANCSGAKVDPGIHMLNQALYGNCDVITGDYLAGKITETTSRKEKHKRIGFRNS